MQNKAYILGAGITGLAAGFTSGLTIFEAEQRPGGICSSYYIRPGNNKRLLSSPKDGEAFRFEIGGGHWIFGSDPLVLRFIKSLCHIKFYTRKSAVYFPDRDLLIPYPIQNHLRYLGKEIAVKALIEMIEGAQCKHPVKTFADWLQANFGNILCELFFFPFHDLYTAGLYKEIAPQDAYKSPVDLSIIIKGAFDDAPPVGYNVNFIYPLEGLDTLVKRMAERCNIQYGKRVVRIDAREKVIYFEDGSMLVYEALISTLPLNKIIKIVSLTLDENPCPSSSVLVCNIGAFRGSRCPQEYWVYIPTSKAGFHRVGFYSNVEASFLPASAGRSNDIVSIYVEKAYSEDQKPNESEVKELCKKIVKELQDWQWIGDTEAVDTTWVDIAYTWVWPGSRWPEKALKALEEHGIYQIGRYGKWVFQGIAESIRDGFVAGSALK